MKILIYEHRKNDGEFFDISTPEKELAAYLCLFLELDVQMSAYSDIEDVDIDTPDAIRFPVCEPCLKDLHRHCEKGNCSCDATAQCKENAKSARHAIRHEIRWKKLYDAAQEGDGKAAKTLMDERSRQGFEYEELKTAEVEIRSMNS